MLLERRFLVDPLEVVLGMEVSELERFRCIEETILTAWGELKRSVTILLDILWVADDCVRRISELSEWISISDIQPQSAGEVRFSG